MAPILLGNLKIDPQRYEAYVGERPAGLTYLEFELLYHLARSAGRVHTRAQIMRRIWGEQEPDRDRKLTVHMSRLRKKLQGSEPWQIETVTKRGYGLVTANGGGAPA